MFSICIEKSFNFDHVIFSKCNKLFTLNSILPILWLFWKFAFKIFNKNWKINNLYKSIIFIEVTNTKTKTKIHWPKVKKKHFIRKTNMIIFSTKKI